MQKNISVPNSVERIPPPTTLTFDLELPKFNYLVPVAKGITDEVW